MSGVPLFGEFATCRAVEIPTRLDHEARRRFVAKVRESAASQATAAAQCDAILALGEVREDGDMLVVAHERAAPLTPAAVLGNARPDINSLLWATWCGVRALRALGNQPHGSLHLGSFFQDELGRLKLADSGVAPAFESACGVDARRYVLCAPPTAGAPKGCSGVWRLADEDESHDYGWIAPYFPHELLEGRMRLNPKSDQFALGVMLYLWGAGAHPYGTELHDPTQMVYFQIEPTAIAELRADWSGPFDRDRTGVARSADRPVLQWWDLVHRLLAADPKERFGSLEEAENIVGAAADSKRWAAACEQIAQSAALLESGDIEKSLQLTGALAGADDLPALWRERIAAHAQKIESQKALIQRKRALKAQLAKAQAALDAQDVASARAIACQVHESPEADDAVREAAERLLREVDEHEEMVRSGAAELVRHNLAMAREALAGADLEEAHAYALLVEQEPALPAAMRTEVEQVRNDIEAARRRIEKQMAILARVAVDRREGRLDQADASLQTLLSEGPAKPEIAEQARVLTAAIEQDRRRIAGAAKALAEAREALERGDVVAATGRLAAALETGLTEKQRGTHAELASARDRLQGAAQAFRAAQDLLDRGQAKSAADRAAAVLEAKDLPETLRGEIQEFVAICRRTIEDAAKAALERALGALARAEQAHAHLNTTRCRELIQQHVLTCEAIPDPDRVRATRLLDSCQGIDRVTGGLDEARRYLAGRQFEKARQTVESLNGEAWPTALTDRISALQAEIAAEQDRFEQERRGELERELEHARKVLASGRLDGVQDALKKVLASDFVTQELRAAAQGLSEEVRQTKALIQRLDRAEAAFKAGELEAARTAAELPPAAPAWAVQRASALLTGVNEAGRKRIREAGQRIEAACTAAAAALAEGDPQRALRSLEQARADLAHVPELESRAEKLADEARNLAEWLPKLNPARQALEAGKPIEAGDLAQALQKQPGAPAQFIRRAGELAGEAGRLLQARRAELERELAAVSAEIAGRGRRAREAEPRLKALFSHPLASEKQRGVIQQTLDHYRALPPPKSRAVPVAIGSGAVLLAAAVILVIAFHPKPPPPAEVLATLQQNAQAAIQARAPRFHPFELLVDPADRWPTTLSVRVEGETATRELGPLDDGELPESLLDKLLSFVKIVPPPSELLPDIQADAERKVRTIATRMKPFVLSVNPTDRWPTTLSARIEGESAGRDLGVIQSAELPQDLIEKLADRVRLAPPPSEFLAAMQADAEQKVRARTTRIKSFELSVDPQDGWPTTLHVKVQGETERRPLGELTEGRVPSSLIDTLLAIVDARPPPLDLKSLEERATQRAGAVYPARRKEFSLLVRPDPADAAAEGRLVAVVDDREHDLGPIANGAPAENWLETLLNLLKPARPALDLAALTTEASDRAARQYPSGRKSFTLGLRPENEPAELIAVIEGDERQHPLGRIDDAGLASGWLDALMPLLKPERVRPKPLDLAALTQAATERAGERYPSGHKQFSIRMDPPDSADGRLLADIEGQEYPLGPVAAGVAPPQWLETLLTRIRFDPPPIARLADWTAQARAAAERQHGDSRELTLAFEPGDRLPATLVARVAGVSEPLNLGEVAADSPPAGWMEKIVPALRPAQMTERMLLRELERLAQSPQADPVEFAATFRAMTTFKAARYGGASQAYVAAFPAQLPQDRSAADAELLAISRRLHATVAPDTARRGGVPLVFVELFASAGRAHGFGWIIETDAQENPAAVVARQIWSLDAPPPEAQLSALKTRATSDAALGDALLGVLPQRVAANPGGGWGIVIAPDAGFWVVPWDQLRLSRRALSGLKFTNGEAVPDVDIERLGGVLATKRQPMPKPLLRARAGIWVVPCLAGTLADAQQRGSLESPLGGFQFDRRSSPPEIVLLRKADNAAVTKWNAYSRGKQPEDLGWAVWEFLGTENNRDSVPACVLIQNP